MTRLMTVVYGISDPWPLALGSWGCAVAVSMSHLPGIMSHILPPSSVCLSLPLLPLP
jgi:hypothetical protein